jgi:hypothetical protein
MTDKLAPDQAMTVTFERLDGTAAEIELVTPPFVFNPDAKPIVVTYTPAPPKCRVYWGTHGCKHERGHSPEIPHECWCCECEQHPDPDPDNPNSEPSCVAGPPYYGRRTRYYGEDAEALGLPLVKGA